MPKNKEALIRYRIINRCLKNYRYASMEKIIQCCEEAMDKFGGVRPRTIYHDMKAMREDSALGYNAPIKYDKLRQEYYYEDPDYSIDNIPLNEEEVKALSFAATMLSNFSHVDIFSTFTGAVQKVVDTINIRRMSKEQDLLPFIEFEHSPVSLGHQHIQPIILAIRDKMVIRFIYRRFDSDHTHEHHVHPYLLKQYHHRWYLIGLHHELDKIFTYCLDRFETAPEVTDIPYHDNGFDTRKFYKSVIGIIAPTTKPEKVILKFTRHQAWYVITQPIHPSQKVKMNDDHVIVELKVIPTYELRNLIMGWGPEVEVLEPEGLREEIRDLHEKSAGIKKENN